MKQDATPTTRLRTARAPTRAGNWGRGAVARGSVALVFAKAGCLPLDDLSSYSRAAVSQADADVATAGSRARVDGGGDPVRSARSSEAARPVPLSGTGSAALGIEDAGGMQPPGDSTKGPEPGVREPGSEPGPGLLPPLCEALAGADEAPASCHGSSSRPLPWPEALAACAGWGGWLVSINSAIEDERLGASLSVAIWIGASDREDEGVMRWANGAPFEFQRFAPGEPNNAFGIQDCVERRVDGTWGDRACAVENFFVCERPSAP